MPLIPAGTRITGQLLSVNYSILDNTSFTVTASTMAQLSQSFTVAANDASAVTAYRLTAWGNGQWGSMQQPLAFQTFFGGTGQGADPIVGLTQFSASAFFRWDFGILLQSQSNPATNATWETTTWGNMSQIASNVLASVGANGSIGFAGGTSTTFIQDSTAPNALVLKAAWQATTGAPTITCQGTLFERLGQQ